MQNRDDRNFQEEQGVKLGPFGSNCERQMTWMQIKDGPGPGHYTSQVVKVNKMVKNKLDLMIEGKSQASTRAFTAQEKERSKVQSVFQSTTDRFVNFDSKNINVRILN